MSKKLKIEIDESYQEHLDLMKQMFPEEEGKAELTNNQVVEELIESFMVFLQQQAKADHEHSEDGGCCGDKH
ncbi:MAG: hypothetical protein GY828_05465 [Candidatus Gracilibacteria bacterium]|nr:hypothetical protein [Candidatus Gracilibacteria bacterium]